MGQDGVEVRVRGGAGLGGVGVALDSCHVGVAGWT